MACTSMHVLCRVEDCPLQSWGRERGGTHEVSPLETSPPPVVGSRGGFRRPSREGLGAEEKKAVVGVEVAAVEVVEAVGLEAEEEEGSYRGAFFRGMDFFFFFLRRIEYIGR